MEVVPLCEIDDLGGFARTYLGKDDPNGYNRRNCKRERYAFTNMRHAGIEPATSCVTGRCSNQIELPPHV